MTGEQEPISKDIIEAEIQPWSEVAEQFRGDFNSAGRFHEILQVTGSKHGGDILDRKDYFGTLAAIVFAQNQPELAHRLLIESRKPYHTVNMMNPEAEVGIYYQGDVSGQPTPTGPNWRRTEHGWREVGSADVQTRIDIVMAIYNLLKNLDIERREKRMFEPDTLVQFIPDREEWQRDEFAIMGRLMAKNPAEIDVVTPVADGQFEERIVDSTIEGYTYRMWGPKGGKIEKLSIAKKPQDQA